MKKFIVLLLIAVMCLSFVACSGCSNNEYAKYEKYADILQMLEDGQYDSAINEIKNRFQNAETNAVSDENLLEYIEITFDNWTDYFELKDVPVWEVGEFGDVYRVIMYTCISVKSEYADKIVLKKSQMIWETKELGYFVDIDCDFENRIISIEKVDNSKFPDIFSEGEMNSYSLGKCFVAQTVKDVVPNVIFADIARVHSATDGTWEGSDGSFAYEYYPCEITRIQGTIAMTK